jgi:hypothetical protein
LRWPDAFHAEAIGIPAPGLTTFLARGQPFPRRLQVPPPEVGGDVGGWPE